MYKTNLLLILDGWGYRQAKANNAIAQANGKNWQYLLANYPNTLIETHGLRVGLPEGQMGNSEVGHMNIGAGRVIYQDLTRIDQAILTGDFFENNILNQAISKSIENNSALHIFGLLSPGGVHSHEQHIFAMLDMAKSRGVKQIYVHAFLDGRDTPPKSAKASLQQLQQHCEMCNARIATITGRYYAMDRDKRWDRVALAYDAIVNAHATYTDTNPVDALEAAYQRGETDEFIKPIVLNSYDGMKNQDVVLFMNFRADRARQLTAAFVNPDFDGFERSRKINLAGYFTLTEYAQDLPVTGIAFLPQRLENTLGEYLSAQQKTQLRIAETEKYAHVTFFFNGGREAPFLGEERILVPSPKVATYDLQPEMSLPALTEQLVAAIHSQQYDLIVCNIANPDMVGHTGVFSAAIKAVEAVDIALGKIMVALDKNNAEMLVTADHGNIECMTDENTGQAHTQHTTGPVPLVYYGKKNLLLRSDGALQDIAPTLLELINLPKPNEMTGSSLLTTAFKSV